MLFPSTMLKHLEVHSSYRKTTITHNNFRHYRVSFSPFVRQPFSKQLYSFVFFRDLILINYITTFLQKLKQHLQRTKQGSKSSQTYGRQSPLHGDHTAIPASRLPQSIPISIPLTPRPSEGPQKRSLEGLNSEIQKLVLTDTQTERVSSCYVVKSWRDFFMLYQCYEKLLFWGLTLETNLNTPNGLGWSRAYRIQCDRN